MAKEKITDTSKKPQDVSNEERLSNEELDNVAGGGGILYLVDGKGGGAGGTGKISPTKTDYCVYAVSSGK